MAPPQDDNGSEEWALKKTPTYSSRVIAYGSGADASEEGGARSGSFSWLPQFIGKNKRFDSEEATETIHEDTPLLSGSGAKDSLSPDDKRAITISAIFLKDYENGREPTLPSDLDAITSTTLHYHRVCHSKAWTASLGLAVLFQFIASAWEGDASPTSCFMSLCSMAILLVDTLFRHRIMCGSSNDITSMPLANKALLCFIGVQTAEIFLHLLLRISSGPFLVSSALKPVVLFYVSEKARNALQSLARIVPIVSRVLALELLLILSFAAVACRLYSHFESFATLGKAWLSLFQLSTTVVNPSMWMPMYEESKNAAFFFVLFDTATTLYLHSLVLSVVFQTYIQASTEIHDLSIVHQEEAMKLSFQALHLLANKNDVSRECEEEQIVLHQKVATHQVRSVLEKIRPHYSPLKINALVDIYDATGAGNLEYAQYRTKMHKTTSASIRTATHVSILSFVVETTAGFVAVANFAFVMLLTMNHEFDWFNNNSTAMGFAITLLGLLELLIRADPFGMLRSTPLTKLNPTFDGIALLAGLISSYGLLHFDDKQVDFLLTGRAVDMIRIMRFQKIFRDVIQRSGEVIPALVGPVCLLLATNHLFVYLGMAIWAGAIEVGSYPDITPLYDQNNFNSYGEGMVTMFNVLIINDWHAISEVYTYAAWHSSPCIVYPFFILGNLISVNVMLNCLVAFFVGAFVAEKEEEPGKKGYKIDSTSQRSLRRISSGGLHKDASTRSASTHQSTEVVNFDVFERTSYEKIMRTVSGGGGSDSGEAYAKDISEKLELFEALSPEGGPKRGFLTCCSTNRFGNRRFQTMMTKCMDVNEIHSFVSGIHSELLKREEDSVYRSLTTGDGDQMSVEASLIQQNPPVSMLVASGS